MSNEKPEAIELADLFDNWSTTYGSGSRSRGATELRRQHARIQELEAMLEAVAAQEPFGYFKAEPFGWRDCADTDEGAIALYEAPQPQADGRDAQRYRWLIDYFISDRVDLDDAIVAAKTSEDIAKIIDAAIAAAKEKAK